MKAWKSNYQAWMLLSGCTCQWAARFRGIAKCVSIDFCLNNFSPAASRSEWAEPQHTIIFMALRSSSHPVSEKTASGQCALPVSGGIQRS